jgi:thiamine biosynthesis protein ThiI
LITQTPSAIAEGSYELELSGRAVFLISGGIDSPVAAWLLIRKGIEPIFAYFDNYPPCDQAAEDIALASIRKVCASANIKNARIYVIAHSPDLQDILSKCPVKFACILSRRMMFRISEQIAIKENCSAIITGDAIGQKASQTVQNIIAADHVLSRMPVLRPLVGINKLQIVKYAKEIGTYTISISPGVASCGVPTNNPSTSAKRDQLTEIEQALDLKSMVKRAIRNARILTV